jgi:hypothetical protein
LNIKEIIILLLTLFSLAACSGEGNAVTEQEMAHEMEHMHHFNGSAEVPKALAKKAVENPTYPIGSKAISKATHMGGMMENVEVTIVAAYQTTAYETSFVLPNGTKMENHRWIVHEEFVDPATEPLASGTEIKTTADHMEGMKDSIQTIDSSVETTVYIVDFVTADGHEVKNHKWISEEELEPVE